MTSILVSMKVGLQGRYKLIRRKQDETIVQETEWSKNMIVDRGLNHIGGSDTVANPSWGLNGCQVGSGNTAPAAGQTTLQTYVAGTITVQATSSSINAGASPPYTRIVTTWRFGAGVAAGNIAEVGIGIGTTASLGTVGSAGRSDQPLFSRALIVDGGGSPTVITVLSDEFLDVVWEYTKYAPAADGTGNFTIVEDGIPVNYAYTVRAASSLTSLDGWSTNRTSIVLPTQGGVLGNVGSSAWDLSLQPVFDNVSGGSGSLSNSHVGVGAYVGGSFQRDSIQTFGLSNGNIVGGIDLLYINLDIVGWQMSVVPPIAKNSTQVLTITYRTSWANVP